jgi:serine/threonine protein kinase
LQNLAKRGRTSLAGQPRGPEGPSLGKLIRDLDTSSRATLGRGSYGTVTRAIYIPSGKVCAVKRADIDQEDCLREMELLKSLRVNPHRNVMQLLDVRVECPESTDTEHPTLVMICEHADMDLKKFLSRTGGQLKLGLLKTFTADMLAGLSHVHRHGILHRDLKPANLLVCHDDDARMVLKLADFGMARRAGAQLSGDRCTTFYRAPELWLGATDYGMPMDIWSAGAVLGEMLIAEPLFPDEGKEEGEVLKRIMERCGPLTEERWPRTQWPTWQHSHLLAG